MRHPARAHGKVAHQPLMDHRLIDEFHGRKQQQDDAGHDQKERPAIDPEGGTLRARQPIHKVAEEGKQRHFNQRYRGRKSRRNRQERPEWARIVDDERPKSRRGHLRREAGEWRPDFFQPIEKSANHRFGSPWRRSIR